MLGILIGFVFGYGLGCVLTFWIVFLNAKHKITTYNHEISIGGAIQLACFSWIGVFVMGFDMINTTLTKTEFFSKPVKELFKRE